jgi:Rhs element Vgr protein
MGNPPSPTLLRGAALTFTIKVNGSAIPSTTQVVSVDTWVSVNRIPRARVVIYDGSAAEADFPASASPTFLPGNKIEIAAGYVGQVTTIFSGVIVKQGIEVTQTEASRLVVQAADPAMIMTLNRKSAVFPNITDSDLIGKLISANGLSKDVTTTSITYEDIVQNYSSDWDLMLTRAELNGFVVTVKSGKVTVAPPDTQQPPVLLVEYGTSILDLNLELNAARQYAPSAITSYSWDESVQEVIGAGPAPVAVQEQGNVTSATLAQVFNVSSYPQQTGAMIGQDSLRAWSSAELLKSKLSKIQGQVSFQGSALAEAGKTIQLAGVGDRFNGTAFISGVHHEIKNDRWITTVTMGLSWPWFTVEAPSISAPEAGGQVPPIQGLQTGKVKQVSQDPSGEFRVQVTLPLLRNDANAVWARLGGCYASNKFGAVFFPEVGDEVVVGFMNNDPRFPVILGSVYSKKLPPAYPPDDKNATKAIVTRSKLEINFDDDKIILQIVTPKKQTVTLDDNAGTITIADSNKNQVTLSSAGITLDSGSNLSISAKGNITITAQGNLQMKATANATLDGLQVTHTAQTKFSAQGSAQAELKSSGILTLQGTLVKIN